MAKKIDLTTTTKNEKKFKAASKPKGIKEVKSLAHDEDQSLLELHEELWDLELDVATQERLVREAEHLVDSYEKDGETVEWHHNLIEWDHQYEGILPPKDYPWEGCANYHVPITEMNVNAYYARIIRRFRGMDYLRVKAYKEIQERAILTQRYLRYLFLKKLQWVDLGMTTFRDIIKFGTGVYCTTFTFEERKKRVVVPKIKIKKTKDPITGAEIPEEELYYAIEEHIYYEMAPKVEWVSLFDYFRSNDSDRFATPVWEARRIWKSAVDLWKLGNEEEYDPDNVKDILMKDLDKLNESISINEKRKGVEYLPERELIEFWGWMRLTDDPLAEPQRIVLTYDRKSKKFLRAIRFPYFFDESNFTIINFERRANTWRGRGICEKLEHLNAELDKLHNIHIDSSALVASKSFKKKRGADTNFLLTDFYPGVVWTVNRMDDIEVMELGSTPVSVLNEMNALTNLGERQTGIGSLQMGQESGAVSQPTASGQLAVLQEGNVLSDEISKEFSEGTIRIARQVLSMLREFRPEDEILEVEDPKDAELIIQKPIDVEQLIEDPELIVVDRSVLEETEFKNRALEVYNIVINDSVMREIPRIRLGAIRNVVTAYKVLDDDLMLPTEEEVAAIMQRISEQAQIQILQETIAKGQLTLQAAQIQAQTRQFQAQMQAQMQAQEGAATRQQQAAENERDRQLQLELQAREQEGQVVQQSLQQPPAGTQ